MLSLILQPVYYLKMTLMHFTVCDGMMIKGY